jgi:hypothetical protein
MAINLNNKRPGVTGLDMIQYAKQIDFDDANEIIYIGEALPSTAPETSTWRIKRVETNPREGETDGDLRITFASGTADFDKQWSARSGYTYS